MKYQTIQAAKIAAHDFSFTAPVTIEAAAAPSADGSTKLRRFNMVAYTGGLLHLPKISDYPIVADLSGMEGTDKPRPALKDHSPAAVVGHTDKIVNDGKELLASGIVSGTGPAAKEVVGTNDNGFPWQASIGAKILKSQFVPAGRTVQINGQTFNGPLIHAQRTRLGEISFVALGADDNTSARIAAQAAGVSLMTFEQWLKAKGFGDVTALNDTSKQFLKAQFDAEIAAAAKDHSDNDDDTAPGGGGDDTIRATGADDAIRKTRTTIRAAATSELKRISAINTLVAKYTGKVTAEKLATIQASAIDDEWDADKLELELIRSERPTARGARGGGGGAARTKLSAAVICAALSLTAQIPEKAVAEQIATADREKVMNEATSGTMRGFSLHALMDSVIHAAGDFFHGSRKSNDFIRAAFQASNRLSQMADGENIEADGFSSLSLPGILSNVANKGLIASYTAVEVAWPNVAAVRSHSDFKIHTRYRLDSQGAYRKVGPDGELKNIGLTDASYTNQVATYGALVALTRQMMFNDDLGAFMEIPNLLGRMAALRLEEAVMILLLSNPNTFFNSAATPFNRITGAASALSIDSLIAAEAAFTNFVDSNGKPVLVSPDRMLVGSTLKTLANNLYTKDTVIADGIVSTGKSVRTNNNPYVSKFKPVVSPYINNTAIKDQDGKAIAGQSASLWFMLADPAVRAALAVAFLNGQRTPTIESGQTNFDTLGMQWRSFNDFGVGMEEQTSAVQADGA
jgi:hypothetical protein